MTVSVQVGEKAVSVTPGEDSGAHQVTVGAQAYTVAVEQSNAEWLLLRIDGQPVRAVVAETETEHQVWLDGEIYRLPKPERRSQRRGSSGTAASGALTASMPGQVVAVPVAVGDAVTPGTTLVILESMKMEQRLTAPRAGTVTAVNCRMGETVDRGQVLVQLEQQERKG